MKILALILSLYIFALNLVPCEDTDTFSHEVETEFSQTMDHNHDHQDADLCSPFCQCHCCHIHVTHFKVVEYNITSNTHISTQIFHYSDGLITNFNPTILQPPQV